MPLGPVFSFLAGPHKKFSSGPFPVTIWNMQKMVQIVAHTEETTRQNFCSWCCPMIQIGKIRIRRIKPQNSHVLQDEGQGDLDTKQKNFSNL